MHKTSELTVPLNKYIYQTGQVNSSNYLGKYGGTATLYHVNLWLQAPELGAAWTYPAQKRVCSSSYNTKSTI